MKKRLSRDVALRIAYRDETVFGSMVSGRCDNELRKRFAVLGRYRERYGLPKLVRNALPLFERVLPQCLEAIREGPGRLREAWLYPEAARVRPAMLCVMRNLTDVTVSIALPDALSAELASWLGQWQQGSGPPRTHAARELWDALVSEGALEDMPHAGEAAIPRGITFVGHATVCASDGERRLLIDPFLLPASNLFPAAWQPLSLAELGTPDAVLVTHSHPDHYDIGSLLRCGADTPIYVPAVRRESVLAIDMAARLRELGFRTVHAVEPWTEFNVGAMRVIALPFYGEQPTIGDVLHAEVRNEGASYVVEVGGQRFAAVADGGSDCAGDVKDMAARARSRYGAVDTVFGGYRGFAMYPAQYLFSSVTRYLPFVPAENLGERQKIMCDGDDLIDLGERWRAKRVVPYANGGAPWYWMRGLGPALREGVSPDASGEPGPQHVVELSRRRSYTRRDGPIAAPVEVLTLRPGDYLAD